MNTKLVSQKIIVVAPPPNRFTFDEWECNNRTKTRFALEQQHLADRILAESERICDKTSELAKSNKSESTHFLNQRIDEIQFALNETRNLRKEIVLEVEALSLCKERFMDALAYIQSEALRICKTCLILRDGRLGIDLVHDDLEKEMHKEIDNIEGAQLMLKRVLGQINEQIRRLQSTIYFMDRDLEAKSNVLKIDKNIASFTEKNINLSIYHGHTSLGSSDISLEEWEQKTAEYRQNAASEKNCGVQLRSYVDILIKQITDDLWNQYNNVNAAFDIRIKETKSAKMKLELQHSETTRQVNEMRRNLTRLEIELAEKEGYVALAHTRLGFRKQREALELCRDNAEVQLLNELSQLNENVASLQTIMNEAQASLRYLLKVQVQLAEDINIKSNTLKIDEVDCMTMRQSIVFNSY